MYLGCNETDITPNIPVHLGGYMKREEPARGVAAKLFARSFVFRQNDLQLGLITADLIMLRQDQAESIRVEASKLTGIDPDNIIVACSHTHSGPSTDSRLGNPTDSIYLDWLTKTLAGSLYQAANDLEKVEAGYASAEIDGISANRRDPNEDIDRELTVLGFRTQEGKLKGLLFNFACHPTVLGADNLLVSSEYPGAAAEFLKTVFPETIAGFMNGACGDISTRFTRGEQTHQESKRLGKILGAAVVSLAAKLTFSAVKLAAMTTTLSVDAKEIIDPVEAEKDIEKWKTRLAELKDAGASAAELRLAQTGLEGALLQQEAKGIALLPEKVTLQLWRFGNLGLVTMPGELFSGLGETIRKNAPFENMIISGYSNDFLGYIPHREAYEQGGYEALSSPLAPGFGEKLVVAADDGFRELAKD